MIYRCNWDNLARSLAVHGGQTHTPRPCESAPTHYVSVRVQTPDYIAELLSNLCAEHEQEVRRLDGWVWSRPKQVTA